MSLDMLSKLAIFSHEHPMCAPLAHLPTYLLAEVFTMAAADAGVRPVPLEIHIQGFDITNLDARMQAMARPCYSALTNHAGDKPTIVFVPSKRHARQTAVDLWAYASAEGKGDKFLQVSACWYHMCASAARNTLCIIC